MIRAAVIPAPGKPVEVREFPEPALEPESVLLRTLAAEVCGTDVHLWHGRLPGVPYPLIPGHVSVGRGRLRAADRRSCRGAGPDQASRPGIDTGKRPRGIERLRARAAERRGMGGRNRRAGVAPGRRATLRSRLDDGRE